ncbi:MAG: SPOR domain-containing protein [Hyphomicrobiaceae bacterium]|nr:SPOR domain-containing protein [Hyphomicrobiaceae bacterium]
MVAHIARSRRFIKIYLSAWALLACGALAYLAVLTFPPQAGNPTPPQPQSSLDPTSADSNPTSADSKGGSAPGTVMAQVRSMQGSLSEIRKDVSQLQEAVGERVTNEKVVQTRLSALEGRVSTIDGQATPASGPTPASPSLNPSSDKTPSNTGEPSQPAQEPAAAPSTQLETGSIAKAEIVFGEPVVKRANGVKLAVQLATGPSPQELRLSWGQLAQQHGDALSSLKPRVVAPRGKGGAYRLIAGPVATEADATRICGALGAGPATCFPTPYGGTPL